MALFRSEDRNEKARKQREILAKQKIEFEKFESKFEKKIHDFVVKEVVPEMEILLNGFSKKKEDL
jgi:hypothetical protein